MQTVSVGSELDDVADPDVDDAQESLVLLLELLLIEHLHGEDAVFIHSAGRWLDTTDPCGQWGRDPQVETLVPVGVQRPLGDGRRLCLFAVDRGYGKWIRKAWDD